MSEETHLISQFLANLADNLISNHEKNLLVQIFEKLFDDLALGHSCSNVQDILLIINCDKNTFDGILLKSRLATIYHHENELNHSINTKPIKHILPLSLLKTSRTELLFITKYLQYEISIAQVIKQLKDSSPQGYGLGRACVNAGIKHLELLQREEGLPNLEQLNALKNSLEYKFSMITGGPGTGKTTTIVFLLWLFYKTYGANLKIKLCSPTGKATKRVQESIVLGLKNLTGKIDLIDELENLVMADNNFMTIHRLLKVKKHSIHFRHDENNPLDVDILIIDESSMISLPMFSKLLKTVDVAKIRHIIFLGDKNQLSSVEEGYVFATLSDFEEESMQIARNGDLFAALYNNHLNKLMVSKRNSHDVGKLADFILARDSRNVLNILKNSSRVTLKKMALKEIVATYVITPGMSSSMTVDDPFYDINRLSFLRAIEGQISYLDFIRKFSLDAISNKNIESKGSNLELNKSSAIIYEQFYKAFTAQTILCLTNIGSYGIDNLNNLVEQKLKEGLCTIDNWYIGRAIMILENNYSNGLSNGDIGFCLKKNDDFVIVFRNNLELIPEALPKYQLAYAITIHKSQGSEYNNVNVVLVSASSNISNNLLNRELLYTAVTRARTGVIIAAGSDIVREMILTPTRRMSGLKQKLWGSI